MEKFVETMVDMLDTEEEIGAETVLADIDEWDSLSFVAFVAMAKGTYGKTIVAADVRAAKTIADLYELVK